MSGSTTAILSGLTIPVQSKLPVDHTYVASDCGFVWKCFGSYLGGTAIVGAVGNSFIADCLSQPAGTAEITYGKNGVCHQAANRILHPANVIVDAARGYNRSFNKYGDYGFGPWNGLTSCYQSGGGGTSTDVENQQDANLAGKVKAMSAMQQQAPVRPDNYASLRAEDIRKRFDPRLMEPLTDDEVQKVLHVMSSVRSEQQTLAARLQSNEINHKDFLYISSRIDAKSMDYYKSLLGLERFIRIFGASESDDVIDSETYFRELEVHRP